MGTVRGDLHDIGKNLVCMMAEGAGFEVHDIGVDQSVEKFLAAADKCKPTIIGMSALLTTTMTYMKTVIDGFEAAGLGHIKMAVGGAPISQTFADEIGADGYGANASAAVDLFLRLAVADLIPEPPACSVTVTINGRTVESPPGPVAVRLRRARGDPRADVLPDTGPVQGVHRRDHRGDGPAQRADRGRAPPQGPFRLSCQCRVAAADGSRPVPHDAPRADAHRAARARPRRRAGVIGMPDPAVTRDGDRVLHRRRRHRTPAARCTASPWTWGRPPSCCASSTWKPGEIVADTSFENPQRFGGSDVMARIQYDTEHGRTP